MDNPPFDRIYQIFIQLNLVNVRVDFENGFHLVSVLKPEEQKLVVHLDKTNSTCVSTCDDQLDQDKCQLFIELVELFVKNGIQKVWFEKTSFPGIQTLGYVKIGFDRPFDPKWWIDVLVDERILNSGSCFKLGTYFGERQYDWKILFCGKIYCRFSKERQRDDFWRLQSLEHQNIEKFFDICETDKIHYQTEKYIQTFSEYLSGNENSAKELMKILLEILSGIECFRKNDLFHGRIHENNIAWNGTNWLLIDASKVKQTTDGDQPMSDLVDFIVIVMIASFNLERNKLLAIGYRLQFNTETDEELMKTDAGRKLKDLLLTNIKFLEDQKKVKFEKDHNLINEHVDAAYAELRKIIEQLADEESSSREEQISALENEMTVA